MKKLLTALSLMIAAASPARAQTACADVFRPSRESYAQRLRAIRALGDNQNLQEAVDFRRRLISHLFVETDIFLRDQSTGKWLTLPPRPTAADVKTRLRDAIQFVEGSGSISDIRQDNAKLGAVAVRYKMTAQQADQVLATLHEAGTGRADEAAEFLALLLGQLSAQVNAARDQGIKGQYLKQKAADLVKAREGKSGVAVSTFFATGLSTAGAIGYYTGLDIQMLWALTALPVAFGAGHTAEALYNFFPGVTKIKETYANARARSRTKALAKDFRKLVTETASVEIRENADFAFEKAWEDWRLGALEAEGARNKARIERVTDRLSQLSLLLQTTGLWQLPNGERYADAAKDAKALSEDRKASLNRGVQRKQTQLDLMLTELEWVAKDLDQIRAENGSSDESAGAARRQLAEGARQNVRALRGVIEDRQDHLRFIEDRIDSGPNDFQRFIQKMNETGSIP